MADFYTCMRFFKSSNVLLLSISLLTMAMPVFADNWDNTFNTAVSKLKHARVAGANGDISVVLQRNAKDTYDLAGLGSNALPMPAAEKIVRDTINNALKVIPAHPKHFKYVYFTVSFQNGLVSGIGGPYYKNAFAFKTDNDLLLATGLKKKEYEDYIEDKLKATDLRAFAGSQANQMIKTRTNMKLSNDGHILSMKVIAPDDDSRQLVYKLLGIKQPFGKMPNYYYAKPDFSVDWCWQRDDNSASSAGFQRVIVRHLDY